MSERLNPLQYSTIREKILARDKFPHHTNPSDAKSEAILAEQQYASDISVNPKIEASLVIASWGVKMNRLEHAKAVYEHVKDRTRDTAKTIANTIPMSGADETYWTKPYKTRKEALDFQIEVGTKMGQQAIEALGVDRAEIGEIIIASGTPISALLPEYIRSRLDLPSDVAATLSTIACASSKEAFYQLVQKRQQEREEGNIAKKPISLLITIEAMTMFRNPFEDDPEFTGTQDPVGLSLFGDGGFALAFNPSHWEILGSVGFEKEDTYKAIAAIIPSPEIRHTEPTVVADTQFGRVGRVPYPDTNDMLKVKRGKTAVLFHHVVTQLTDELSIKLQELYAERKIPAPNLSFFTHALVHRPSRGMYKNVISPMLRKLQLPDGKLSWWLKKRKIPANAPAQTFGIELSRVFDVIKPGDTMLAYFFSAGAYARATLFKVRNSTS